MEPPARMKGECTVMTRWINAHEPAMTRPEAALLSALPPSGPPARLLTAPRTEDFRPVETAETPAPPRMRLINRSVMLLTPRAEDFRPTEETQAQPTVTPQPASRRESAAGRAILSAEGVMLPGVGGACRKPRRRQPLPERRDGVIPAKWLE